MYVCIKMDTLKRFAFLFLLIGIVDASSAQSSIVDSIFLSATNEVYYFYADYDVDAERSLSFDIEPDYIVKIGSKGSKLSTLVNKYIDFLEQSKEKYLKWSLVAQENETKSLSKKMFSTRRKAHCTQIVFFYQNGQWYSCRVNMSSIFHVDGDGRCYMILETGALNGEENVKSSSNNLSVILGNGSGNGIVLGRDSHVISYERHSESGYLTFSSIEEIDSFINKLRNIASWKDNSVKSGKLFK